MNETEDDIIKLLQKRGEMFTAEIAKGLNISSTTASKYLGILEAKGKVEQYKKTPYIFWKVIYKGENDGT